MPQVDLNRSVVDLMPTAFCWVLLKSIVNILLFVMLTVMFQISGM
uniref:Uncharacterized protein n=1 Tax=Setaria italica TaxID=4555 RepID=K3ZGG7_SETIT